MQQKKKKFKADSAFNKKIRIVTYIDME